MPEFSFHHGGVSVPDLDAAIEWYGRVLGYELEKRFYIEAARSHTAMVRKGPLRFELFQVEGAAPLMCWAFVRGALPTWRRARAGATAGTAR